MKNKNKNKAYERVKELGSAIVYLKDRKVTVEAISGQNLHIKDIVGLYDISKPEFSKKRIEEDIQEALNG